MLVLSQRSVPSDKGFSQGVSTFTKICLNLLIEPGNLGVSTFTKICPLVIVPSCVLLQGPCWMIWPTCLRADRSLWPQWCTTWCPDATARSAACTTRIHCRGPWPIMPIGRHAYCWLHLVGRWPPKRPVLFAVVYSFAGWVGKQFFVRGKWMASNVCAGWFCLSSCWVWKDFLFLFGGGCNHVCEGLPVLWGGDGKECAKAWAGRWVLSTGCAVVCVWCICDTRLSQEQVCLPVSDCNQNADFRQFA